MNSIAYTDRWNSVRLASLFTENTTVNSNLQYTNAYQFFYGDIVPKKEYELTEDLLDTYSKYTVVQPNDIMINGLNLNYDFVSQRVALIKEAGIITSAYICLRPNKKNNAKYFSYLLKSLDARKVFHGMGTGIRLTLSWSSIKNLILPVPPRAEQDQIVRYLDWKVSEVNKLINIKKDEIDKLNEEKLVLITSTVTHGLNNKKQFRDSKNRWIGEVPVAWDVTTVGRVYKLILGKMLAPQKMNDNESLEAYFCAKDIHFDGVDKNNLKKMWFKPEEIKQYQVQEGDLLIVEGGAGAGGTALAEISSGERIMIQNSVHLVRPSNKNYCVNEYLYYWMYSLVKRGYMEYCTNVATIPHFTKEKLSMTPLPLPPVKEQKAIADFLNKYCLKVDSIINAYQEQIKLLKEYKSRLISDVVTGQIDVRDIEIPEYEYVEETADIDSEEMTEFDESEDEEV